ncbi:MAG: stage III sporulation AC/AD family protein [Clostridia bacterium]|nr:stage III sporulation AC/AD family protein [Clostridia bacterium]
MQKILNISIVTATAFANTESGFEKLCACLLISAALVVILKNFGFKGAPLVAAVVALAFASSLLSRFSTLGGALSFLSSYPESEKYVKAAAKAVGIGYLAGISSDICREIGEAGIGKCITVGARIELVILAVPFIEEILSAAGSLVS